MRQHNCIASIDTSILRLRTLLNFQNPDIGLCEIRLVSPRSIRYIKCSLDRSARACAVQPRVESGQDLIHACVHQRPTCNLGSDCQPTPRPSESSSLVSTGTCCWPLPTQRLSFDRFNLWLINHQYMWDTRSSKCYWHVVYTLSFIAQAYSILNAGYQRQWNLSWPWSSTKFIPQKNLRVLVCYGSCVFSKRIKPVAYYSLHTTCIEGLGALRLCMSFITFLHPCFILIFPVCAMDKVYSPTNLQFLKMGYMPVAASSRWVCLLCSQQTLKNKQNYGWGPTSYAYVGRDLHILKYATIIAYTFQM